MLSAWRSFGFSGSRSLAGAGFALCRSLAASAVQSGAPVLAGCANGADAAARSGAGSACRVFSVRSGAFGAGRGAFARRSAAFIRALAALPAPVLFVFPGAPCPAGLVPSASPSACFCGLGSGSWASAALAAGYNIPVVVFGLYLDSLPASWGCWSSSPVGGFLLSPQGDQLPLF